MNVLGGAIIGYNSGIVAGLSLPLVQCTLPGLDTSSNVSLYQGIFTALILVFAAIGSPLGVFIKEKRGMKMALYVMGLIATVFPILMILWDNYWYVTVMRGILGLSIGFSSALCSHYANSLVKDEIKGRVGSLFQLSVTLFIFLAQLMNYLMVPSFNVDECVPLSGLSWRLQLGISSVIGAVTIVTLFFAPDVKEPKKELRKFKSTESLFSAKNIRWLIFAVMLAVMNQLTGINGVMYYCAQILSSAGIDNVLFTQMIVVGLWNMLTVFIFMAIVDRLSRRSIFIIALSVMIVGTIALILSFMISGIPVVALIGMLFYILGFESGPGPLFYVMATQDFPKELVAQGLSVSNIILYVLNIAISLSFPILTSSLGAGYTFVILCGFQVLCLVYFGFTMRTKKTLPVEPVKVINPVDPVNPVAPVKPDVSL